MVAPGGDVHLVGMPGNVTLELTSLWHRETPSAAATPTPATTSSLRSTSFAVSIWAGWCRATYPLNDYTAAIAHAANSGRRGAVKIAFDLRHNTRGNS